MEKKTPGTDVLLDELFGYEPGWDKAISDGRAKGIKEPILVQYSSPSFRAELKARIRKRKYHVMPPHEAQVPKDDGSMRTVYANEARDRLLMTAINDMLFRLCSDMINPACKSYQSGIGCGKIARQVSRDMQPILDALPDGMPLGYKIDLSKYFDSVPINFIDWIFDQVEARFGPSAVLDLLREYYHDDRLLDLDRKPFQKYTSLRQGCAVAAFLADAVLKPLDDEISSMPVAYYRYSDDILILGEHAGQAFEAAKAILGRYSLALNPKKIEILKPDAWFTFLGFSLRGDRITLSKKRVRNFQKAVEQRTFRHKSGASNNSGAAMQRVARYLYDDTLTGYGYAEGILPVVNSKQDLRQLDLFILDCLRACDTGKTRLGGLGWDRFKPGEVICRGAGRHVGTNREKRGRIQGYVPLSHMQALFLSSRPAYEACARQMLMGGAGPGI